MIQAQNVITLSTGDAALIAQFQSVVNRPVLVGMPKINGSLIAGSTLTIDPGARDPWVGSVPAFLPLRLPLFIVGIASAALWHRARVMPPIPLAVWVLTASVLVAVTAPSQFPIAIWAAVYYLAATHGRLPILSRIDAIFTWSVFRYLGRISFGVYVLHVPTMMLICYYIVFPLVGHLHSVIGAMAISLLTIPPVVALASLTYRIVELPFIKLGRTAFQRTTGVGERIASIK